MTMDHKAAGTFGFLPGNASTSAHAVDHRGRRDLEFAIGPKFLEPAGRWTNAMPAGSGDNQHGQGGG
jgi:hypothetical protein